MFEKDYGNWISKRVKVIGYCNPKEKFECHLFKVEVVNDCDGSISFIVKGEGSLNDSEFDTKRDVWIMRTDDFNQAYDLKNKLDTLPGDYIPNEKQKMPCFGQVAERKDNVGVIHRHDQN